MDKRNLILNIIIGILIIAIAGVTISICTGNVEQESKEDEYRRKIKENITYEYITKPQEEQNKIYEEEMKNIEEKKENLRQNLTEQEMSLMKKELGL